MLVVIHERYPLRRGISLFPLFWRYLYSRSQSRCATDDPMPNSARYRSIIAHCDYCYVNGTATGLLGTVNELARTLPYRSSLVIPLQRIERWLQRAGIGVSVDELAEISIQTPP